MTGQIEIWVNQAHWRDRWNGVKQLPGGGQGNAWRVRRKGDGQDGFLKAIRAKRDPERRARFSREANAYATVTVRGIPRSGRDQCPSVEGRCAGTLHGDRVHRGADAAAMA